jgi:hypothetical protein
MGGWFIGSISRSSLYIFDAITTFEYILAISSIHRLFRHGRKRKDVVWHKAEHLSCRLKFGLTNTVEAVFRKTCDCLKVIWLYETLSGIHAALSNRAGASLAPKSIREGSARQKELM